jgi:hypothetical protein
VVISERMIAFAHVNDEALVDKIPIDEIVSIEGVVHQRVTAEKIPVLNSANMLASLKNLGIQKDDVTDTLRISTHSSGHNAGREYFLRASSSTLCEELIGKLTEYSDAAKRADSSSWIAIFHQKLRMVYVSEKFQSVAAVLIILVLLLKIILQAMKSSH